MATPKKDDSDALAAAREEAAYQRGRAEAALAARTGAAPEGREGAFERETAAMAARRAASVRDGTARDAKVRGLLLRVQAFPGDYCIFASCAPTNQGDFRCLTPIHEQDSKVGLESILAPKMAERERDLEAARAGLLRTPSGDMVTPEAIRIQIMADTRSERYGRRKLGYAIFGKTLAELLQRGMVQILAELPRDAQIPEGWETMPHDATIPTTVAEHEARLAALAGSNEVAP